MRRTPATPSCAISRFVVLPRQPQSALGPFSGSASRCSAREMEFIFRVLCVCVCVFMLGRQRASDAQEQRFSPRAIVCLCVPGSLYISGTRGPRPWCITQTYTAVVDALPRTNKHHRCLGVYNKHREGLEVYLCRER